MWLKPCAREVAAQRVGLPRLLAQVAIGAVQADRDAVEEPRSGGRVREALEVGRAARCRPGPGASGRGPRRRRDPAAQAPPTSAALATSSGQATADARLPRGGRPRSPRRASGAPIPASPTRSGCVAPSGACSSCSASTVKPQRPSSAMSSPWGRWNSTDPSLHWKRRMPNCGSASASPEGWSSSCIVSITSGVLVRNHSRPAGTQEPRRLGDPRLGIAPQARAVLRDRDVEGVVGQRHRLGAALDEREVEAVLGLQRARRGELLRSDVDADRARSAARQPRRDVGRAAAELDHVAPVDLGQRAQARLGDLPRAPGDLVVGPVAPSGRLVVGRLDAPGDPVGAGVVAEAHADWAARAWRIVLGSMKRTSSWTTSNSSTCSVPRARKKATRRWTSSSGALAPEVMPTTRVPSSHSSRTCSSLSIR